MNAELKNWLIIALKNAVNAVLASSVLKVLVSGTFQFNSPNDWWNFGKALFSVILAREIMVWLPIILKWSSTSSNPAADLIGGGVYVPPLADRAKPPAPGPNV